MTAEPPTRAAGLYLFKQVELAGRARLHEIVRPRGVTVSQYTALALLEFEPDLTSAELARRSFVRAQSMADLVGGLMDRGLIERQRDARDRRRLVIALTPSGRELLTELRPRVAALQERIVAGLTQQQTEAFYAALESCRAALGDPPPAPPD